MKRRVFSLAFALLLAFALAVPALAAGSDEVFVSGSTVDTGGEKNSSVFASGQTVSTGGTINGVLIAAGYTVNAGGDADYIMSAGYNVYSGGDIGNDAFLSGYSINVSGLVERDVFAAGNSVIISGKVGRNVYATGSSVIISGIVDGDIYISADSITVTESADVTGTLHYNGNASVSFSDKGSVGAYEAGAAAEEIENDSSFSFAGWIFGLAGLVALAYVILWLTGIWEKLDAKYTGRPFGKFAAAFGIGCAVLAGVPVAAVILMIARIGVRLGLIMLLLYAALIIASPVFASFFVGGLVWRRIFKRRPNLWLEIPIGIAVYKLVTLVPVFGTIVSVVFAAFGIGAAVLLIPAKKAAASVPAPAEGSGSGGSDNPVLR